MGKTKIALLQMKMSSDPKKNIQNAVNKINSAAKKGAKVICLPELFMTKYFCQVESHKNFNFAEKIPGPSSNLFSALARELKVILIISLFEKKTSGLYHNSSIVINEKGKILGKYRKMHIPDDPQFYEKFYFAPGDLGFKSFKTSKGNLEVKLFGKDNPVTVSNFLQNIENNIYANQKFYKIINYPQIRFIHGGVNPENDFYIERNQTLYKTSPTIPLEIKFKEEIKPRYNYQIKTPNETENLINTFESGSIAMVKRGKNNSSSTEFFFVTNKIPELDGRYSIFGKIIKGLDVIEKINKEDYIKEVKISN